MAGVLRSGRLRQAVALLEQTLRDWFRHRCISKGAALAFYALFSLAPMLVLVIALAGAVFGRDAAAGEIYRQLEGLVGPQGADAVEALVQGASDPAGGLLASLIAGGTLLLGSTTAFAELKASLDEIWSGRLNEDSRVFAAVRDRLLSFGLVLVLAFLLLVSLVVNAALSVAAAWWTRLFGAGGETVLVVALSSVATYLAIAALFAAIYRLLPPARLAWSDVAIGAAITALLFAAGKAVIGLYLGHASVTSSLGAAGSFGVLILWVYYSAQLFFLGAEFTRLYAQRHGSLRAPRSGTRIAPGVESPAEPLTPHRPRSLHP